MGLNFVFCGCYATFIRLKDSRQSFCGILIPLGIWMTKWVRVVSLHSLDTLGFYRHPIEHHLLKFLRGYGFRWWCLPMT